MVQDLQKGVKTESFWGHFGVWSSCFGPFLSQFREVKSGYIRNPSILGLSGIRCFESWTNKVSLSSRNSVLLQKPVKTGYIPLYFEVVLRVLFRAVLCPHFWEPIIDLGMDYRIQGITHPSMVQFRVSFWRSIWGYVRNPLIWGKSGNGCFESPTNKVSFSSKNSVFQMKPIKRVTKYDPFWGHSRVPNQGPFVRHLLEPPRSSRRRLPSLGHPTEARSVLGIMGQFPQFREIPEYWSNRQLLCFSRSGFGGLADMGPNRVKLDLLLEPQVLVPVMVIDA